MRTLTVVIGIVVLTFILAANAAVPPDYTGKPFEDSVYQGGPQVIPGKVECAFYDLGGEGVAYHDTDAANNGNGVLNQQTNHQRPHATAYHWNFRMDEGVDLSYTKDFADFNHKQNLVDPPVNQFYIGWTEDGEWCNYTVDVKKAGPYTIIALYGNDANRIQFSINNKPASECKLPVVTGSMHKWNKAEVGTLTFPEAGRQLLTFHYNKGNNFAYFEFVAVESALSRDWPHWRGPRDNGSVAEGTYPVKWDAANVLWRVPLPGKGSSTPIVWDKRIFLTAPQQDQDAALAFDWEGKALWQTTLGSGQPGKHPSSSACNPSPVTDGRGIFVAFKSGTLAALNLDGTLRWKTNLVERFGPESRIWDAGTSPVLTDNAVVMARMHDGDSWVAAFDKGSGQLLWKVAREYQTPVEGRQGYSTPILVRYEGKDNLLVWGAEHLTAYNPANGQLLWSCGDFNPDAMEYWPTIASPVQIGDKVIVSTGRSDRGQPRLYGIQLGGKGDVTATHRVWNRQDTGTFVPTPVEYRGRLYLLRDRGEVECIDPGTGQTIWRDALPKSSRLFYASPTIAAGKLYAAREDGVIFVARIEEKFELLSENKMDERVIASPVPVLNRLLIRGEQHLFCVEGR